MDFFEEHGPETREQAERREREERAGDLRDAGLMDWGELGSAMEIGDAHLDVLPSMVAGAGPVEVLKAAAGFVGWHCSSTARPEAWARAYELAQSFGEWDGPEVFEDALRLVVEDVKTLAAERLEANGLPPMEFIHALSLLDSLGDTAISAWRTHAFEALGFEDLAEQEAKKAQLN